MKLNPKILLICAALLLLNFNSSAKALPNHQNHLVYTDDKDAIQSVVMKFLTALHDFNFEEAKKYTLPDNKEFFEMMEHFSKDPNAKQNPIPTIKDVQIEGNKASVTLSSPPMMKLEKENGQWKIDVRMKPLPKEN
ncbi:MAG: hypothetical protein IE931_00375 [Sphingobacteriales bacterium]|nr:hypothetical protein [Sphingobacteriales bacterium]